MVKLKTEGFRESRDNTITYINGNRSLSSNNVTVFVPGKFVTKTSSPS